MGRKKESSETMENLNLKTLVYNKTEGPLKLKSYHKNGKEADVKEIEVVSGETKTIDVENMVKEDTQEIHVLSGEQLVQVLESHDFENKGKKLLVLEMVDDRFHYSFVHWIWSTIPHPKRAVLMEDQRLAEQIASYTDRLKTRIDNKTDLRLTIRGHYKTPAGVKDYYGPKVFEVGPRGRKTIRSGVFLKESWARNSNPQEIHVRSGKHVVLVLSSEDFQNNKGKELVLDIQDDHFGYAFLPTQPTTSWKNWLCCSITHKSPDMEILP